MVKWDSYLVLNAKFLQDFSECDCQVNTGMGTSDLDDVEKH